MYIEGTNKNGTVHFYWPKTAREEDRQPWIMDQQQEHEMRVQLGREHGVRLTNEGRETAQKPLDYTVIYHFWGVIKKCQ